MDNDYQNGYKAHEAGEPYDLSQSEEWRAGWMGSSKDDESIASSPKK